MAVAEIVMFLVLLVLSVPLWSDADSTNIPDRDEDEK